MKKLSYLIIIFVLIFTTSFVSAKTQKEEYQNDILYSEEYFDYLIECASIEKQEEEDLKKQEAKLIKKNKKTEETLTLEENSKEETEEKITPEENYITGEFEPFKLKIKDSKKISPYKETYEKTTTKAVIPVSENFSFIQNASKSKNEYYVDDYKIITGAEYSPSKFFSLSGGFESKYGDLDQSFNSKKIFLNPSVNLGENISLDFKNKINAQTKSVDHNFGINISPFKSKTMDFGAYAGVTKNQNGTFSESINFSTNFYFF